MTQQPCWARPLHFRGFMISLRHTILGRIPLDECSAQHGDLCDNTQHSRETDIHAPPPAGFEPTIPASERPQTHALDCVTTENNTKILLPKWSQVCLFILQLEPGIQDCSLPWMFLKHKPSLMLGKTWRMTHLTIFMCFQSDIQV